MPENECEMTNSTHCQYDECFYSSINIFIK